MRKEVMEIDKEKGIVRVTVVDERWYGKSVENPITKIPEWMWVPSVTWIAGHYPKGIQFYKWLAEKGWDEAESIKVTAGDKGSKVHAAISMILTGEEVRIDTKIKNRNDIEEELIFDEIECIQSFLDWKRSLTSFVPIAWDLTVFDDEENYAGSIDLVAYINDELWVIDFKTSQYIWTEYELQTSAYKRALQKKENELLFNQKPVNVTNLKIGILQVGYKKNKALWKWNEIEDRFDDFLIAKKIWTNESGKIEPKKRDLPIVLSPALKPEVKVTEEVVSAESVTLPLKTKPKTNESK